MDAPTPQQPAYTIHFTPTADDSRRAAVLGSTTKRSSLVLMYFCLSALGVMLILFPGRADVIVGATLALIGAFLIYGLFYPRAGSVSRQQWRPDVGTFTFEEQGITVATRFSWRSIRWEGITEIHSDKRSILFMRGPAIATWLPRSAFDTQAESDAVIAFARAHIAAPKATAASPT